MADVAGNGRSLADVAAYGVRLATTLHIHMEISQSARKILRDVVLEISATVTSLKQLDDTLSTDEKAAKRQGLAPAYKPDGATEVKTLAVQCERVYRIIVGLLHKASELRGSSSPPDGDGQPLNLQVDPGSLKPLTILMRGMMCSTEWLEPRIGRCHEQLRWLKAGLLLHLQLVSLAKLHLDYGPRSGGTFDSELSFRTAAEKLRIRQLQIARKAVKRQNRKLDDDDDETSTYSEPESDLTDDIVPPPSYAKPATGSLSVPEANPVVECVSAPRPTEPTSSVSAAACDSKGPSPPWLVIDGILKIPAPLAPQVVDNIGGAPRPSTPAQPPPGYTATETSEPEADFVFLEKPGCDGTKKCEGTPEIEPMTGLRFPAAKLSEEKQVTPSTSPLSTFANLIPNWVQGIFGSSEPMADSASVDLEAYIAEPTTASAPVKIPLGHERLKFGLSRVQKNKKGSTWFRYMDMNSVQRGIVDEVVKFAKTQSHHVRTCIAVEEFKREGHPRSYLIFFSLAEPPKSVSLKDAVGRQFSFPYELCRDWEGMHRLINEAFLHVEILGPHVNQGHYDLINTNGDIIMPSLWSTTIRPGDKITMHMWPMNNLPPRFPRPGPPVPARFARPGPPVPPPGAVPRPPPPMGPPMQPRPPPGLSLPPSGRPHGFVNPPLPRPSPPAPKVIHVEPEKTTKKKRSGSAMLAWLAGNKFEEEEDDDISQEEEAELAVVDFRGALDAQVAVAEMLCRFTNVKDVHSELMERLWDSSESESEDEDSDDDSHTVSDGSTC